MGDSTMDKEDKAQINSMIDSVTNIIDWLETGRNPYFKQGIDVRYAYDLSRFENMDVFPDILKEVKEEREEFEITPKQRKVVILLLNMLSERERDCFLLRIQGYTLQEIADSLGVSVSSVQTYLERVSKKVEDVRSMS